MDKNSLQQFQKFLTAVSDEIKSQKKPLEESVNLNEITQPTETINKESHIDQVAKYLSLKTKQTYNAQIKNEEVQIPPQDIESQRWKDPLVQDKNFVTFKEMNDHYGLFLQRIQQQMSTMGGGGEVNFSRLDDINSASVGLNKYLTYDQVTKKFEFDNIGISDGLYLNGDNEITLAIASTSQLGGIKTGTAFEIDGSDKLQLKVATETDLGGIRLGPGVTVNGQDQIIIDSSGLDFSFGDFAATVGQYSSNTDYAVLSAINEDEDIIIASNGAGKIQIVGEFKVHPTNGFLTDTLEDNPIFSVSADGQVKILVPAIDSIAGAVSIVGSTTGEFISPVNTGVMLHVTGQASSPPIPSRIYNDSQNAFAAFVARRFNGSIASPTAVLDNEEIMRISGTAHNGTIIPGTGNQRIVYRALGNQTLTNQGGAIELWTTPLNSSTIAKVATIDNADGITSTKFTGPLTGNVTGNVSGTAGSVAAANVTGTTLASNVVTSSLTTVGTLTNLTVTNTISGSINGNAGTVTNGVYTSGDQTIGGTKTFSSTISGSINGTANVATTVTLVATNTTDAIHYPTFVDSATGNENVRTDTGLTYNPSTGSLTATKFTGQLIHAYRDIGVIADGGTVTVDFSTDAIIHVSWDNGFTLAYQNYTVGSVVKLLATKRAGTGTDSFSLDGITASQVSGGSTTVSASAGQTYFVEFICTGTDIGSVYAKL